VKNVTQIQYWVYKSLLGARTDEELVEVYRKWKHAPRASDSGIRSRRAELVSMGLVEPTGIHGQTKYGRKATVWQAVLGKEVLAK